MHTKTGVYTSHKSTDQLAIKNEEDKYTVNSQLTDVLFTRLQSYATFRCIWAPNSNISDPRCLLESEMMTHQPRDGNFRNVNLIVVSCIPVFQRRNHIHVIKGASD